MGFCCARLRFGGCEAGVLDFRVGFGVWLFAVCVWWRYTAWGCCGSGVAGVGVTAWFAVSDLLLVLCLL